MAIDSSKVSRDHCLSWASLPTINPLTRRKIEKDKARYKELREICSQKYNISTGSGDNVQPAESIKPKPVKNDKNNKHNKNVSKQNDVIDGVQVSRKHCTDFAKQPTINPLTGRKIQKNKAKYNQLKDACKSTHSVDIENGDIESVDIQSGNIQSGNIDRDISGNVSKLTKVDNEDNDANDAKKIRSCSFATFRPTLPQHLTPKRASLPDSINERDLPALKELYKRLGICEAPLQVDLSFSKGFKNIQNGMDESIAELLHLMHGNCVDHRRWRLHYYKDEGEWNLYQTHKHMRTIEDGITGDSFKVLVDAVKKNGKPICTCIGVSERNATLGHALMLVLYKPTRKDKVHMAIIDPNMTHALWIGPRYHTMIMEYMEKNFAVKVDEPVTINSYFQQANSHWPVSSLDSEGYCATWVCLMMDLFGKNVNSGMTITGTSDIKKAISLPISPFKPYNMAPWRKLIIDYAISRMFGVYWMATKKLYSEMSLGIGKSAIRHIESAFMFKYLEYISLDGVKDELVRYMKEPDGKAFKKRVREYKSRHFLEEFGELWA